MQFTNPVPRNPFWVFFIFSAFFFSSSFSDPRTSVSGLFCGSSNHSAIDNFIPNFISVMEAISINVIVRRWAESNVTSPPPQVYAYAQCHDDLSSTECSDCFAMSRTKLPRCLPSTSARIYLDGCFLRYDNHSFYKEATNERHDKVTCDSPIDISKDKYMGMEFCRKVKEVIGNVTEKAVKNEGFAVMGERGGVEGVYALAQCWKTLGDVGCKECLEAAGSKLNGCLPGQGGKAMYAGCYLRYSTKRFYDVDSESEDNGSSKVWFVLVAFLSAMALAFLALFGAIVGYKRLSKRKGVHRYHGGISISVHKSSLNFKYEILEKATDSFDPSRKLGQGGAGSVFKGILPDGRTVAVKRLFFNTRQWVDEFFNEVNLISGIQHKNLVKLLGCSIEGPESLLVYEYLPNRSLDHILFVKNSLNFLSWRQRFDIISGTAEGLAYLHGGCKVKIIHRDIKTSNILLDEHLIPKIGDFGLARCVSPDKSHISTGIAGTLGYMAPEYLVRGVLTDKADVYAFGVLVLEIVCGRKNSVFTLGSSSVLHSVRFTSLSHLYHRITCSRGQVWKHYKGKNIAESVDPDLKGNFPVKEASDILQIGLLCTQASQTLRPSMSEVVQMLTDIEYEIPSPKQPPFLNASVLASDNSRTSDINSITSNGYHEKSISKVSSYFTAMSTTISVEVSESR